MTLLNKFSSETAWTISTNLYFDPVVETGLSIYSNGHAPLTVLPIYGEIIIIKNTFFFFKTKNCSNDDPFISCNERIGKMLHNICISVSGYVTQVSEKWPMGLLFLGFH